MNNLLKTYNTIIKSNLEQIDKTTALIATLVEEELIQNEFHKEHLIAICQNNLIALNNSLIDNQMMFALMREDDYEILNDVLISYIKNRDILVSQLNESKLLFSSICKKKFNNELKSEMIKRKTVGE